MEGVNDCLLDHCQVSSLLNYCGFKEQEIPRIIIGVLSLSFCRTVELLSLKQIPRIYLFIYFFLEGTNGELGLIKIYIFFGCESLSGDMSCVGVDWSQTITIFCCSVRPMFSVMCGLNCSLFMVVSCSCFYVVFIFNFLQQTFILLFILPYF